MQIFDVIIFFELRTIQQKTVKPTSLCPLGARKLAEGKGHETHIVWGKKCMEAAGIWANLHVLWSTNQLPALGQNSNRWLYIM